MNPLLARQLVEAARQRADGQPDLDRLCALVSDSYDSLSASHGEDPVEAAAVAHAGLDLQTLLDNLADAMLAVDDQGLVRLSNKSAAALFHCDPAQLLHAHIFDLLPPAEVGEVGQFLEKLAESSHAPGQSCELDARRDDGERFRVALKVSDVLISGERRFVVSLRDISRRLQRQQELADSEARFRTLVENAPEAIIVFDADERVIVDTNANARALLDLDNLQPGTQSLVEISAPLQRDGVRAELASVEYFARAMAGEAPSFEWRFQRPGQQIDFDAEVRYVRLPGSQRNLIRASITDVSERLRETRSARLTAQFERLLSDLCAGMLDDRDGEAGAAVVDCLRRLSEFGGVCRSRIFQFTTNPADRTDLAECTHAWGEIAVDGNGQGQRLLIDTELPWLSARIRQLDVFDVPSVTGLPGEAGRERRYFEDAGVSSLVAVPMTIGGRLAGFMLLESQQTEGHWPEEILGRLRLVADICGAELRRKTTAAAQARLMAVLNATPDLVVLCDRAGVLLQANDAAREQLGLDEFGNGKMLADLFAEGDEVTGEGLPTAIRDGSWRSEASWQLGDGRQVLVSQITLAHRDGSGSIEYFSTIARDISERAAVAAQLRNSEQNLLMALSAAGMVTWSWNIDDGQMNWSEQVDEFFGARGYRFGSHIDSYLATVHKDDRAELQRGIARALSSGAADLHSEHRILNEDARSSWVEFQGCIERDDSGQPCRMVGTTCDISARKRAEMALCEEKERALVTLDSIADAVVTTDEHGLIQTLNRAAEQRLDIAAASVAGLSIDELFTLISDENGNPVDNPVMQCLEEGRTIEAKTGLILRASNGAEFAVQFSSAPIR
ncbi:MAG: PAS domain S-box protein, partial [Gammaproteobacteria bacterium]|nr:PAS domain S-box protein [Gammaproteobacteria bacterium]